jgi:peptide/nickel transport system permease protein
LAWIRRRRSFSAYWKTFRHNKQGMVGLIVMSVFIFLALFGPLIVDQAQLDPATATGPILHAPTWGYPLGTDNFGRSVLGLVVAGARVSLMVGLTATLGAMILGAVVGISSGYFGGKIDSVLNFITNWFLVIPWIALAIVLASLWGRSLFAIIVVIAVTSWAGTARLTRSQALSVRERTYVERSRALGSGHWHLVSRHIFPNILPVLFANTVLTVALAILSETTLALLGLGDPNSVSWGITIEEAFTNGALTAGYWWWLIPPGVAIVMVTLSFTMCGYALDEILSPKLRDR